VFTRSGATWSQDGAKLAGSDSFGAAVALSADGSTAVIGAPNAAGGVGSARVFTRSGGLWTQQGTLTGTGESGTGGFGSSVAVSADGSTALVGCPFDDATSEYGAAFAFTRSGATWSQQGGKLVGNSLSPGAWLGWSVALSGNGTTALVGGNPESSTAGQAFVFARSGSTWSQQANLSYSGASGGSYFGWSVSLADDGSTALVGGPSDNGEAGAAWLFARSGTSWTQSRAKLTGSGAAGAGDLGYDVTLSADGKTALAGGPGDSSGTGAVWAFATAAAPEAPTNVHASADDKRARVDWVPGPAGASPATGYMVTPYAGGVAQTSIAVGPGASTVVTGLTNGTSYTFTVTAQSAVGSGAASASSNAVIPNVQGRDLPDPPAPTPRQVVPDPPAGVARPSRPPAR
jgi:hypothetical protein